MIGEYACAHKNRLQRYNKKFKYASARVIFLHFLHFSDDNIACFSFFVYLCTPN